MQGQKRSKGMAKKKTSPFIVAAVLVLITNILLLSQMHSQRNQPEMIGEWNGWEEYGIAGTAGVSRQVKSVAEEMPVTETVEMEEKETVALPANKPENSLIIPETWIDPQYVSYAEEIVSLYYPDLSVPLVVSVIEAESDGRAGLVNELGCKGLMQVYEKYHRERMEKLGVTDLLDPYSNILTGCDILNEYIGLCGGDIHWALMRYNGTRNAAERAEMGNYTDYVWKVMDRAGELEAAYAD